MLSNSAPLLMFRTSKIVDMLFKEYKMKVSSCGTSSFQGHDFQWKSFARVAQPHGIHFIAEWHRHLGCPCQVHKQIMGM